MPICAARFAASTCLAAALAFSATIPAAAQEVRDLDRETSNVRTFPGVVGAQPARFEVSLPAGALLKVDAVSTSSIDPYLTITNAQSGHVLGEDDDSGGELNAQVTIRPANADRRIAIEVKQVNSGGAEGEDTSGAFELRLANFVPKPATRVTWGASLDGTIVQGAEHSFVFAGEAGMVVEVALIAQEDNGFDPYLAVFNQAGEELAADDDSGANLNAYLRHVMSDDAALTITASGYSEGAGNYTLRVGERREPIAQAPLQMIGIADVASGRLGAGYEAGGIDPISIDYQLSEEALAAIAGGMHDITITMAAITDEDSLGGGLDPYLELGLKTPLGFAIVDSDDDSAGDLNAMIPLDLSAVAADPGLLSRLRIRAIAIAGSAGDYTLTISPGMEMRAAPAMDMIEPVQ